MPFQAPFAIGPSSNQIADPPLHKYGILPNLLLGRPESTSLTAHVTHLNYRTQVYLCRRGLSPKP